MSLIKSEEKKTICRLPWFLVEVEADLARGFGEIGLNNKVYEIIHLMDIIDKQSLNMYIDKKIKFNWQRGVLEGKIIKASDTRNMLQPEKMELTKNKEKITLHITKNKTYLIQYCPGVGTVTHKIVYEPEVVWLKRHNETNIKDILFKENKVEIMTRVLYQSELVDETKKALNHLKECCLAVVLKDDEMMKESKEEFKWILVQYSTGDDNITYTIINKNETVWRTENCYPEVVVYLIRNDCIYQALILNKSNDCNQLLNELEIIKKIGFNFQYEIIDTK